MVIIAQIWIGIGIFAALMQILQWMGEGCLCHAVGELGVDRWYYLRGTAFNVFMSLVFGPIVLAVQLMHRMPVFFTKNPIAGVCRAMRVGVTK